MSKRRTALLRGVTAQFLLVTVLPLTAILAVISFASLSLHQDAMRRLVNDRDIRAVMATASSIGALLQHKADALQFVAESGTLREALRATQSASGSAGQQAVFSPPPIDPDVAGEFAGGIAVYDKAGALVTSTAPAASWAAGGFSNPALALPPGAPNSLVVVWNDALVLRAQDHSGTVTVIGVLPVSALQFSALMNPPGDPSTVSAFLFGASGRALASTQPARLHADVHDHPGVAEALRGETGGMFSPDPGSDASRSASSGASGGDEHVVSYAPVVTRRGPTGLGVIIEEPWQTVLDPLMRYSLAMPLITLPVLLLVALAVVFGVRRIVQPLQQLDSQARDIGRGNYDTLQQPVHGIEEVEQLQTTLRTMAGQIQADQERLRSYARAVTETQEAERKRLARELHDETIQSLILLSQHIQAMRLSVPHDQPEEVAKLVDLRRMVLGMIEEVRRLSRALRPIYLEDAGLVAALGRLAVEANATTQGEGSGGRACQVTFSASDAVSRYKPDVELALFRIAQEALSNALRHASPSRVSISLSPLPGDGDGVQLCVEDDGRGFVEPGGAAKEYARARPKPTEPMPVGTTPGGTSGGFGLLGIRERALLIGAHVDILSEPGKGTRIAVLYPSASSGRSRCADEGEPKALRR